MKLTPVLFIVLIIAVVSCASGPVEVPEDTPASKIVQRAQEATDVNKYKVAIEYYQILLERYGDNKDYRCIGEYEIAFIRYKQKRYAEARRGFENLIALYNSGEIKDPPLHFKVLAEKVLVRISEKGY